LHGDHRARCEEDLFVMATIKKKSALADLPQIISRISMNGHGTGGGLKKI